VEKAAILATYQAWSRGRDLVEEASTIRSEVNAALASNSGRLVRLLRHFRQDLLAQLRRDRQNRPSQQYVGFDALVRLADGNPRSFLNLMKLAFSWEHFLDNESGVHVITRGAQNQAAIDAAEWFYGSAQVVGAMSQTVRTGIERLGELLEQCRYSDKPVESSLCAVSVDLEGVSEWTRSAITTAEAWSLLVSRSGRRDRNDGARLTVLQINRVLAPRWGLPTGRRGALTLQANEVDSLFAESRDAFDVVLSTRLRRMNAPFGRSEAGTQTSQSPSLF
jgi:hypothetical protein